MSRRFVGPEAPMSWRQRLARPRKSEKIVAAFARFDRASHPAGTCRFWGTSQPYRQSLVVGDRTQRSHPGFVANLPLIQLLGRNVLSAKTNEPRPSPSLNERGRFMAVVTVIVQ